MKRFHVHLHVDDLAKSIDFYSRLFALEPARREADYAKWMIQDPPVNFAISTRGAQPGIDHLGIQTDDPQGIAWEHFHTLRDIPVFNEAERGAAAACCAGPAQAREVAAQQSSCCAPAEPASCCAPAQPESQRSACF